MGRGRRWVTPEPARASGSRAWACATRSGGIATSRDLARLGLPDATASSARRAPRPAPAAMPGCGDGMLTNLERFLSAASDPEAMARGGRRVVALGRGRRPALQHEPVFRRPRDPRPRPARLAPRRRRAARRGPAHRRAGPTSQLRPRDDDEARTGDPPVPARRETAGGSATNDILREMPLEIVTRDLSHLADACVEAAFRVTAPTRMRAHPGRRPGQSEGERGAVRRAGALVSSAAKS